MINIGSITTKQAKLRAKEWAVYDQPSDRRITFGELNKLVNQMANGLIGLGLEKGDRVSILSQNSIEFLALFFACGKTGLITHTINWRLADGEIEKIISNGAPRAFIAQAQFSKTIDYLKNAQTNIEHWLIYGEGSDGSLEKMLASASDEEPENLENIGDEDPLFILYTGGTTGESKGALHSHRSAYFGMLNQTVAEGIQPTDVYMLTGQMFHIPVLLAVNYLQHGRPLVLMNFDAKLALELIEQEKVSGFLGITTMLNWMLAVEGFENYDLSSLRLVQYGGGPMPSRVIKEVVEKLPCKIIQGYGQTEGVTMTFLSHEDHVQAVNEGKNTERLLSCGREGFVTSVKVVDPDGNEVPCDGETAGEIIIRSPANMIGYFQRPDLTQSTIKDGWMWTGDIATWDSDRYIFIKDRAKDMIISGGENIYSAQVEEAICKNDAVLEAAVIGVPDEEWGEMVKAFVVLKPGKTATKEDIIQTAKENLASYQKPRIVEFIDELPKAPTGKILKRLLRE
ncbi:MAG: AMP-binding protein [Parvibaculales bacterium]